MGLDDLPDVPPSFWTTFESRLVDCDGVKLHAVVGGSGEPVLLIPGWPQSWFAWRYLMPTLVDAGFAVVAVDPKGMGGSSQPEGGAHGQGYDTGSVGAELVALMQHLGHTRFHVVGHDVGMWIGYAMAADHTLAVRLLVLSEALLPGAVTPPPIFAPAAANSRFWHFGLNRATPEIQSALLAGDAARAYQAWQFQTKAASPDAISPAVREVYFSANAMDGSPLHAALNYYRALDATIAQNGRRAEHRLSMPVLAIAGEKGVGARLGEDVARLAAHARSVVIQGAGHYVFEEAPVACAECLVPFLKSAL